MLKMILCVCLLLGGATVRAATVELKGKAAVTGKILEEKKDRLSLILDTPCWSYQRAKW